MMNVYRSSVVGKILVSLAIIAIVYFGYTRVGARTQKMPEVDYRLVVGETVTAKELTGKVIVFNFWSTDCGPCIAGMPELEQFYQDYNHQGVELIAIASWHNELKEVVQLTYLKELSFKVAYDAGNQAATAWGGIPYTPTTFIVDRQGGVVDSFVGNEFERLKQVVDGLI